MTIKITEPTFFDFFLCAAAYDTQDRIVEDYDRDCQFGYVPPMSRKEERLMELCFDVVASVPAAYEWLCFGIDLDAPPPPAEQAVVRFGDEDEVVS